MNWPPSPPSIVDKVSLRAEKSYLSSNSSKSSSAKLLVGIPPPLCCSETTYEDFNKS